MRRALADLIAYGKQYLRSPTATFFTLAFPIILILIFGSVFGSPGEISVEIHVQDLDKTDLSSALVDSLGETGVLDVVTVPSDQDLEAYITDQSITVALLVPAGFGGDVTRALGGDSTAEPEITLYGDPSSSAFQTARGAVLGGVTGFNFVLSAASPVVSVGTQTIAEESFGPIDYLLPGIIGITVLFPLFAMSSTAAEYRERHYFKLLATTPLRKSEFLLSRTVWLLGLTFLSVILMILIARAVFDARFFITPIAVALITAGIVLFVSLGILIGNFARDIEAASAVANVVYFPMMFLSGTFWSVDIMPGFVQTISRALPLTYFNDGLRDTLIFGNVESALTNLGIVAGLAIVLFVLAARFMIWRAE